MLRGLALCIAGVAVAALTASCHGGLSSPGGGAAVAPDGSEGYFAAAEGVRLFYRRVGTGRDAVVYLHGGPASGFRGSAEFMEPLAQGRTLIMYDQRGGGLSDIVSDESRLTMAHNVADLEALRRHFGLERMTLVGLSFGAGLAASYAAEHPDHVARLILVSPMPPTRGHARPRVEKLDDLLGPERVRRRDELAGRLATASDSEISRICREHSDIVFTPYLAPPTREKLAHAAKRCDAPPAALRNRELVRRAAFASLGEYDLRPTLAVIRAPTLVMEGMNTNVPLEGTRVWADAIPGASIVLIPDAGHEFFVDQPAAFLREAERFIQATP